MEDYIAKLPKIELHAHLNGSLKSNSILELGEMIYGTNTESFVNLTKNFTTFNQKDLDACFAKFHFMHDLTSTKRGLSEATKLMIRDFVADNVIYLEIRTTPKSNDVMTIEEYLEVVIHAIETSEQVVTKQIIVKLIPSFDRSKSIENASNTLETVAKLRAQNPKADNIIVGIDLSGNPNCGKFELFKPLLKKAREMDLKLALHCAEIDNLKEAQEMIEFGMERCGHGTFLNEQQIGELNIKNTAIECCLTSNVKCGTVTTYDDHHFKRIFEHENCKNWRNNLVLCTDDSGVFDTTLSQELLIATKHFNLSTKDLLHLQFNAVEHAFASESEKKHLRDVLLNYEKNLIEHKC